MTPELLAATQGAQNIQAPASNLGASQAPELAALYRSSFQLPQSQGAVSAGANIAQDQIAEQKRAAAEAAKRQADLADKSKYRQVPSKNGGYDFYDPDGNQIDIATLTQRTGTKAADWLSDSQDPTDIQYLEDSKNLQDFMNAIVSKDKKKIKTYTDNSPQLNQYANGKGGIHNLLEQFKKSYERYYVPRSQDPNAWGKIPGGAVVPAAQTGNNFDTGSGSGIGS